MAHVRVRTHSNFSISEQDTLKAYCRIWKNLPVTISNIRKHNSNIEWHWNILKSYVRYILLQSKVHVRLSTKDFFLLGNKEKGKRKLNLRFPFSTLMNKITNETSTKGMTCTCPIDSENGLLLPESIVTIITYHKNRRLNKKLTMHLHIPMYLRYWSWLRFE